MARYGYRSRIRKVFIRARKSFGRRMKSSFVNKRIVKFLPVKWWHLMLALSIFGLLIIIKMKKAGVSNKEILNAAKPGA